MKSALGQHSRQSLHERVRHMTPAQRIAMFMDLSRHIQLLHEAGKQHRQERLAAAKSPRS